MRRLAWLFALLAFVGGVANAAITVTALGGNSGGSSTTLTLSTGANSAAGSTIICIVGNNNTASTITSLTASGHTFTIGTVIQGGTAVQGVEFYEQNASAMNSGTVITAHYGASTATQNMITCATIANVNAASLDIEGAGTASASGTNPSIATGTLNFANEAVIGFDALGGSGSGVSYTQAAGFTTLTGGGSSNGFIRWGYKIVSVTSSVTFAPTQGTAPYACNVVTFAGPNITGAHHLTTTGAG